MNWTEYKPVGVQAVDMCAATIAAHRMKYIPIKAIHLFPKMYEQFKSYTQYQLKRELEPGEEMQFDGVYIERGHSKQSTPLVIELWDNEFNIHRALKAMKQPMGIA